MATPKFDHHHGFKQKIKVEVIMTNISGDRTIIINGN